MAEREGGLRQQEQRQEVATQTHSLDRLALAPLRPREELARLDLPLLVELIRLLPGRLHALPAGLVQQAGHAHQAVVLGGLLALLADILCGCRRKRPREGLNTRDSGLRLVPRDSNSNASAHLLLNPGPGPGRRGDPHCAAASEPPRELCK